MTRKKPATKTRRACAIEACDRVAEVGRSGLCGACYQAAYYWKQRTVSHMAHYGREAAFRAARIQQLINPAARSASDNNPRRTK
ncbi:MAG: hypothetical protein E6Q97_09135 [Desulfurellales bacterium]|nr:MAG: hypothetical protein E6Q97_09135 [Desulfurellales bacterium]